MKPKVRNFSDICQPGPPHAKQTEAFTLSDAHEYFLYGGAAGGGKSWWLRWWAIREAQKLFAVYGVRNGRGAIFCENYPALHERQVSKAKFEFPAWLGDWHEQTREFRLKEDLGGWVLAFRNLDDPAKYLSAEFAFQAVDELTRNEKEVFTALNRRRRWPGIPDTACHFAGATNPGGPGHYWVKKLWVDRDFSGEDAYFDAQAFAFLPAKLGDNPALDASYERKYVTEQDRRIYVDGDWDLFEGQYFTEWRKELHVCSPFPIPRDWIRWRAVDYGTLNPFCCLWLAQDPWSGRRYVYRELYAKGLTATRQAEAIFEASGDEDVRFTAADPAMFNKTNDDGTSPADHYRTSGVPLRAAYNDRIKGWNNVRTALSLQPDGKPGLQVFDTCRNLIRTLPQLLFDENRPEDLDTKQEDHAADALRYGLGLTRIGERKKLAAKTAYLVAAR